MQQKRLGASCTSQPSRASLHQLRPGIASSVRTWLFRWSNQLRRRWQANCAELGREHANTTTAFEAMQQKRRGASCTSQPSRASLHQLRPGIASSVRTWLFRWSSSQQVEVNQLRRRWQANCAELGREHANTTTAFEAMHRSAGTQSHVSRGFMYVAAFQSFPSPASSWNCFQ
jgi:hypothetical protein